MSCADRASAGGACVSGDDLARTDCTILEMVLAGDYDAPAHCSLDGRGRVRGAGICGFHEERFGVCVAGQGQPWHLPDSVFHKHARGVGGALHVFAGTGVGYQRGC